MKKYMKCIFSFALGGLCLYLGLTMETKEGQEFIVYFLFMVAIVNIYIGTKDLMSIFKNTK